MAENLFEPDKIRVFSGKYIDVFAPKWTDIDIIDIAHALSMQCRFGGHTQEFYSVAQHSVIVCEKIKKLFPNDYKMQLEALMHDAPEAYILDIPSPNKRRFRGEYLSVETKLYLSIELYCEVQTGWINIPDVCSLKVLHEAIKQADYECLVEEWNGIVIANVSTFTRWSQSEARERFLQEFHSLINKIKNG